MISRRIAYLRRTVGLSQSELAQKLHISTSAEGMYEQGRRTPNISILIQLSRIFNVSLDYLITGTEFNPILPPKNTTPNAYLCPYLRCYQNNDTLNCQKKNHQTK